MACRICNSPSNSYSIYIWVCLKVGSQTNDVLSINRLIFEVSIFRPHFIAISGPYLGGFLKWPLIDFFCYKPSILGIPLDYPKNSCGDNFRGSVSHRSHQERPFPGPQAPHSRPRGISSAQAGRGSPPNPNCVEPLAPQAGNIAIYN